MKGDVTSGPDRLFLACFKIDVSDLAGAGSVYSTAPQTMPPGAYYRGSVVGAAASIGGANVGAAYENPVAFLSPAGHVITASIVLTQPGGSPVNLATEAVGQTLAGQNVDDSAQGPIGAASVVLTLSNAAVPTQAIADSSAFTPSAVAGLTLNVQSNDSPAYSVTFGTPATISDVIAEIVAVTEGGSPSLAADNGRDPAKVSIYSDQSGAGATLTISGSAAAVMGYAPTYTGSDGTEALAACTAGHVEAFVAYDRLPI